MSVVRGTFATRGSRRSTKARPASRRRTSSLRGITLYGINCVFVDNTERTKACQLLAEHLRPDILDRMTNEIGLSEVIAASVDLLEGRLRGRSVVDVDR